MSTSKLDCSSEIYVKTRNGQMRHSAVVGLFLKEGTRVYVVTAKHVIDSCTGTFLVYRDGKFREIGKKIPRVDGTKHERFVDMDIFQVKDELVEMCDFQMRNSKGQPCKFSVGGDVHDVHSLYDTPVFVRCRPKNQSRTSEQEKLTSNPTAEPKRSENLSVLETKDKSNVKLCRVSSETVHSEYYSKENISTDNFLIELNTDKETPNTLEEGDSGALVFTENHDRTCIEVIGILSGEFKAKESSGLDAMFFLCTLLQPGISVLNLQYNKELSVAGSVLPESQSKLEEGMVRSGSEIQWDKQRKLPCQSPCAFDWAERTRNLIGILEPDSEDETEIKKLKIEENRLSMRLAKRQKLSNKGRTGVVVDQGNACFLQCALAMESMYENELKQAEEFMLSAFKEVVQSSSSFRNRLLSGVIQHLALLLCKKRENKKTEAFFDATRDFMINFEHEKSCSKQMLGDYHMHYANFLSSVGRDDNAQTHIDESLRLHKIHDIEPKVQCLGTRRVKIQKARMIIGCLNELPTSISRVPKEAIEEAFKHIETIQGTDIDQYPLLKAEYLLCLTDLFTLQGKTENALRTSRELSELAKQNHLQEALHQADLRCKALEAELS